MYGIVCAYLNVYGDMESQFCNEGVVWGWVILIQVGGIYLVFDIFIDILMLFLKLNRISNRISQQYFEYIKTFNLLIIKGYIGSNMEEGAGFEPASGMNLNTLSKRAT